ncbi:MAG: pitrilysin family protein, partial [Bacteroidales bacterium]
KKPTQIARLKELQKEINEVSLEAVQFAIPNEVDVILGKMGGKGINASTSNDHTVYHNMFPSNQLEKWLMVYAERLRNPVFRLFQSELETVYEEYNMYADDPFSVLMEDVTKEVFSGHPYAIPIIGFPEHLKNPQMSKMQTFYKTFYVPRNMTLILVGDFEVDSLKPLLEQTMGKLENGDSKKETVPFPSVSNIKGQKMITTRQTPVKVGAIVYNSVPASDSQAFYLDICSQLFSNNASTGLLDKLMNDNQLYMTGCFNFSLVEAGAFSFIYVPKIIGQSHEKAEKLIFNAIQDLKTGSFSDDLFEAVRTDYLKNAIEELENIPGKFMTILILEMSGKTADDYLKEIELVKNMSKEDMVKIANHFFQHDYLIYRSNMGSKKKNKIEKPEWKPIIAQNTEAKSEFAQMIEEIKLPPTKPQVIDFNKDVTTLPLTSSFNLYASPNPYNDIFSLKITYQYGSICDIDLEYAIQYFNLQGTENKNFEQFQLELQRMGASFDVEVKNNSTIVRITGFEKDLLQILKLCREKLDHPGNDESKLKILIENHQNDLKMMKENSDSWAYALRNYALFGEKS